MYSFRRLISSRANAKLSTGPRTDAGKRRSSQNSKVHVCCSKPFNPQGEAHRDYQYFRDGFIEQFHPSNLQEIALVEQMARAKCLQNVVLRKQCEVHDESLAANPLDPSNLGPFGDIHAWLQILQLP